MATIYYSFLSVSTQPVTSPGNINLLARNLWPCKQRKWWDCFLSSGGELRSLWLTWICISWQWIYIMGLFILYQGTDKIIIYFVLCEWAGLLCTLHSFTWGGGILWPLLLRGTSRFLLAPPPTDLHNYWIRVAGIRLLCLPSYLETLPVPPLLVSQATCSDKSLV